jgi:hypothetical protein
MGKAEQTSTVAPSPLCSLLQRTKHWNDKSLENAENFGKQ